MNMNNGMWKLYMIRSISALTGGSGFWNTFVNVTCPMTTSNMLHPWSTESQFILLIDICFSFNGSAFCHPVAAAVRW